VLAAEDPAVSVPRRHTAASAMDNVACRFMIRGLMYRMQTETVSKWRWLLTTAAVSYCLVHND